MKTVEFDYEYPAELVAQKSVSPRDSSRMCVVDVKSGTWKHRVTRDLVDVLKSSDLLVFNDSKVFKSRLEAQNVSGISLECFLLRPTEDKRWEALLRPAKKCAVGSVIRFEGGLEATVVSKTEDGIVTLGFDVDNESVFAHCEKYGAVPVPPYVDQGVKDRDDYQTVYAKERGSVAAPTAGFHFSDELLARLREKGVRTEFVTLHVGIGTFRPIQVDDIERHEMHSEHVTVPERTREAILETRKNGGRVIAVGTTSLRALESDVSSGWTDIYITPGYCFKYIDGLITNFHLPKSSLLVLVSAFAGKELVQKVYADCIALRYRLFSFGDAMLLFR